MGEKVKYEMAKYRLESMKITGKKNGKIMNSELLARLREQCLNHNSFAGWNKPAIDLTIWGATANKKIFFMDDVTK